MIYTISKNYLTLEQEHKRNYPNGGKNKTNAEERRDEESYYKKPNKKQKKGGALSSELAKKNMKDEIQKMLDDTPKTKIEEYPDEDIDELLRRTDENIAILRSEEKKLKEKEKKTIEKKKSSKKEKSPIIEKKKSIKIAKPPINAISAKKSILKLDDDDDYDDDDDDDDDDDYNLNKEEEIELKKFMKNFNKLTTESNKRKEIESIEYFKRNGIYSSKLYNAMIKETTKAMDIFLDIKKEKNKDKYPTNTEIKKLMKGMKQGVGFEVVMVKTTEGKQIIRLITGSNSEITFTHNSPNIIKSLSEYCVIDASNKDACLEFKARLLIVFKKLADTDTIGLTTTKLGSNPSFKLEFTKKGNEWKVKNVIITSDKNIINGQLVKYLFDDNEERDYYAIYKFKDCVGYYNILDDMTDDVDVYNLKKKNILVEKIGNYYQFDKCNYKKLPITIEGKKIHEYQIPKTKFVSIN